LIEDDNDTGRDRYIELSEISQLVNDSGYYDFLATSRTG